jgi:hypothetical protein
MLIRIVMHVEKLTIMNMETLIVQYQDNCITF